HPAGARSAPCERVGAGSAAGCPVGGGRGGAGDGGGMGAGAVYGSGAVRGEPARCADGVGVWNPDDGAGGGGKLGAGATGRPDRSGSGFEERIRMEFRLDEAVQSLKATPAAVDRLLRGRPE